MKIKNLFLALSLLTAFGTTEILSQTVAPSTTTAKPKRTYAKKTEKAATTTNEVAKPKRTYTKKTETASTTTSDAPKPKRTYAKKTETTTSASNTKTVNLPSTASPKATAATTKTTPAAKKSSSSGSIFSKVFGTSKSTSTRTSTVGQSTRTGEMYNGHPVYVGSRGGRYYINKNGNKTYIK